MTDIRTRLEGALQQHFVGLDVQNYVTSAGGVRLESEPVVHVADLADVLLALSGIAIVELPEGPWKWALGLGDYEDLYARDGLVIISGIDAVSPDYARELASALLAAANAAEAL